MIMDTLLTRTFCWQAKHKLSQARNCSLQPLNQLVEGALTQQNNNTILAIMKEIKILVK